MKTKCHHLTSLIRLWACAEWASEADIFPLLESRIQREEMLLNSVIEMNSGNDWPTTPERVLIRPPTSWFVVIRTESIFWGMEKKPLWFVLEGPTNHRGWSVGGRIAGCWKPSWGQWFPQLLSPVPKDPSHQIFLDEFQVENKCPKRNDIYLVEYGANEDKAKLFSPSRIVTNQKLRFRLRPNHTVIYRLRKVGRRWKPVNGFEVTLRNWKHLVKTNQLTDEQHSGHPNGYCWW